MRKRRTLRRLLLDWLILYGAGCLVAGVLLAEVSLRLHRSPVVRATEYRAEIQSHFHVAVQDASITAADGAILRGWFVEPANGNGKSVVILHGITANRDDSTGFAEIFLKNGYAVLTPDSRDHGESGGAIATYGVLERYDVKQWVQWMRARVPGCTYLLGESMGAAIGLQATAVTPQLCAVAVESPYSTLRSVGYERLGRGTHTGAFFWNSLGRPIMEVAIAYTRVRYGINLVDADNEVAVERATTPTLLIAGTEDANIPMHHAQELERVCASHCELWIVPGADHGGASVVAHDEFERRLLAWFAGHDR